MTDWVPTEGGGTVEYNRLIKKDMTPRNISPELMNKHKAMIWKTAMVGGFSANPELAGWDKYTVDKKKLLISGLDNLDDVRYVLNVEENNDVLAVVLGKKRELETVALMAAVPVK
jgi:hypothetical protein